MKTAQEAGRGAPDRIRFAQETRCRFLNIVFLLKPKSSVAYVYDDNTMRQALEKLRSHGYTAIPVISRSGAYVGTISDGDFLWFLVDNKIPNLKNTEHYRVRDLLSRGRHQPVRVTATMQDLLDGVIDKNFVPVVDDRNMFVGIITRGDVLKYFAGVETRARSNDILAGATRQDADLRDASLQQAALTAQDLA